MNLQFVEHFLPSEIKEVLGQILSQQHFDFFFRPLAQGIFSSHFPHWKPLLET
jgi:hypothetical protein